MFLFFELFCCLSDCLRDMGGFGTSTRLGEGIDDTHLFGMGTWEFGVSNSFD